MEKIVVDESIFLKSRFFKTAKRLGNGLKFSTLLISATIAYAAFLKRQKVFVILGVASTSCLFQNFSNSALANDAVVPNTNNQIYTRGRGSEHSKALRLDGTPAFVASSKGTTYGVMIDKLDSGGLLAKIGISPGDIIVRLDGRVVETAKQIDRVYEATGGAAQLSFVHMGDNHGLLLYQAQIAGHNPGKSFHGSSASASTSNSTSARPIYEAPRSHATTIAQEAAEAETALLPVINKDRAAYGVPPVHLNSKLTQFARERSADMVKRNYFNHIDPDGVSPQPKARAAGISEGVYENIAWRKGYATIYENAVACQISMMEEPKNEENHRSNILDPKHTAVGIGIAVNASGVVYLTQEFSRVDP